MKLTLSNKIIIKLVKNRDCYHPNIWVKLTKIIAEIFNIDRSISSGEEIYLSMDNNIIQLYSLHYLFVTLHYKKELSQMEIDFFKLKFEQY